MKLVMLCMLLLPLITAINRADAVVGGPYTNEVSAELGSSDEASGKGFSPKEIIVSVGTSVVWTNDDTTEHTVTSGNPDDPDSGELFDSGSPWALGETFEHTFDTVGEFSYFCQIYPWMTGKVTVAEVVIQADGMTEEKVNVKYQDSSFDVTTSLSNGSVKNIDVDPETVSIIVTVETSATEDGELMILLPRTMIDSKTNGDDDDFIILVDGDETEYEETNATAAERELIIPVPSGSEEVEIIGTQVVPEFPLGGLAFIAAGILSVVVMARIRNTTRLY